MKVIDVPPATLELARPMDTWANRLPSTDALAGECIVLELDDATTLELAFQARTLHWSLSGEGTSAQSGYDAVEMRPGCFFVDLVTSGAQRQMTIVLDRWRGRAIVLVNDLIGFDDARQLQQSCATARIAGAGGRYEPIEETRELLGRRLYCEYSDEVAIEHIYLNSRTVAWQWLKVPIAELAHEVGTESVMMWKIAEELFLLHGIGRLPMTLTLLLDLDRRRNVGRVFGLGANGTADIRVGAKLSFLSETPYPDGYRPA